MRGLSYRDDAKYQRDQALAAGTLRSDRDPRDAPNPSLVQRRVLSGGAWAQRRNIRPAPVSLQV